MVISGINEVYVGQTLVTSGINEAYVGQTLVTSGINEVMMLGKEHKTFILSMVQRPSTILGKKLAKQ